MIDRISNHQGVVGVMVFSNKGIAIKSTLDTAQTTLWAALVGDVAGKARIVGKTIEDGSNLVMVRIRSTNYEVMVAPEKDYILVSIHKQLNENEK